MARLATLLTLWVNQSWSKLINGQLTPPSVNLHWSTLIDVNVNWHLEASINHRLPLINVNLPPINLKCWGCTHFWLVLLWTWTALYRWSGAQCRLHKPKWTDRRTDATKLASWSIMNMSSEYPGKAKISPGQYRHNFFRVSTLGY